MSAFREKIKLVTGAIRKNRPMYVQFAVSKRCNLKCRMCKAVESRKDESELRLPEIEKLAEILSRLDIGVLVLTGGEPLLRKDLPETISAFTSRGISVRLQTNAMLATDERVTRLVEAGLKEVTVSLDTLDPDKQDDINNSKGSWERIIKGLSVFSRHLPRRGNISGINIVVSKRNLDEVADVIRFSTAIGFYASLIPVHLAGTPASENASGNGDENGKGPMDDFIVRSYSPEFSFSSSDHAALDRVYKDVIAMKKNGYLVYNSNRFLRESPDFLKHGKIHWRCDSPTLYFSISPEGNFLPCVDIKTDKSILKEDFLKLYRSGEFIDEMKEIVARCEGCMYACWPEITYLCRDPFTFTERMIEGVRISRRVRTPMSTVEMLKKARELRNGG